MVAKRVDELKVKSPGELTANLNVTVWYGAFQLCIFLAKKPDFDRLLVSPVHLGVRLTSTSRSSTW